MSNRKEVINMIKWKTKPAKYSNAEEMQVIIDAYFEECENNKEIPTITGLAYSLNLGRQGLLDYQNSLENGKLKSLDDSVKAEIADTIKRAKHYIETCYENKLINSNTTPIGTIFTLKNNYRWVDKQEIEQTNKTIEVTLED